MIFLWHKEREQSGIIALLPWGKFRTVEFAAGKAASDPR